MSPPNEERRSGRSRHDYNSRTPRGNAVFGDFILGNTIGEGEFGKVKLGWRQDSNAQVCYGPNLQHSLGLDEYIY
jgi:protein-serine/threonine kinase